MSQQVHAPYHFVPLSSWIYMPEWAHLVSQDHPFEQGLSGVLDIELTNATPLLVGAKTTRNENQPALVEWAKDPKGNPIIPGSSLKGMLRNVLEIATFSKFEHVDDQHFAYRDISASDTRYNTQILDSITQAAWLSFDAKTSQWLLRKCSHTVLFSDDFNKFSRCHIVNESRQTAVVKYKEWPLNKAPISFNLNDRVMMGTRGQNVTVNCASELGKGSLAGYPVFTGFRPGRREYAQTRLNFNYLFYGEESDAQPLAEGATRVAKMFDAHDQDLVQYLKKQGHSSLGMPVFLKVKEGKTIAMGFAQMPKVLFDRSIANVAEQHQKALNSQSVFDFTDLLFGTLAESGFSLKSRVMIADAHCTHNTSIKKSKPVILGQPKASYLNAYLEQGSNDIVQGELSQYESNSQLAGWKRYPTQQTFNAHLPRELENKVNVQSQLELMEPGGQFKGKLVFHNLQPVELGAILWALNPDGEDEQAQFYHGLGHGKSLGAGAVQFKVALSHCQTNQPSAEVPTSENLRQLFVDHMDSVYPTTAEQAQPWQNSAQIKHFLAFGNKADNEGKNLTYMPLSTVPNDDYVSYSSSARGRAKPVLPAWRIGEQTLSRSERLKPTTMSLGKGRLRGLLESLQQTDSLSPYEQQQLQQRHQDEQKAKKAAVMASASPLYQECLALSEELTPFQGNSSDDAANKRQGISGRITALLNQCLTPECGASPAELQGIYDLVSDVSLSGYVDVNVKAKDLSKKAKERHRERLELLAQLTKLIDQA